MIRSWLTYLILLLLDALLWISIDGYIYYLLLRVLLMLPLLSLLLFIVGNRLVKLQLKTDKDGCVIRMATRFPLLVFSCIQIQGTWRNCFYETKEAVRLELNQIEGKLYMPKLGSGQYRLRLTSIQTRDLLGLFRKTRVWEKEEAAFRFPQPRPVSQVQFARIIQESRQRPIGPLSSDYELKEHHEGEPVRRIHYKASYRLQKTMVREFQKEESAYLQLHLRFPQEQEACERILAIACGFCLKASAQDMVHIRWQTAGGIQEVQLQSPQDMEGFLRKLLSMPRFCEASCDSQSALCLDEAFAALFEREADV